MFLITRQSFPSYSNLKPYIFHLKSILNICKPIVNLLQTFREPKYDGLCINYKTNGIYWDEILKHTPWIMNVFIISYLELSLYNQLGKVE